MAIEAQNQPIPTAETPKSLQDMTDADLAAAEQAAKSNVAVLQQAEQQGVSKVAAAQVTLENLLASNQKAAAPSIEKKGGSSDQQSGLPAEKKPDGPAAKVAPVQSSPSPAANQPPVAPQNVPSSSPAGLLRRIERNSLPPTESAPLPDVAPAAGTGRKVVGIFGLVRAVQRGVAHLQGEPKAKQGETKTQRERDTGKPEVKTPESKPTPPSAPTTLPEQQVGPKRESPESKPVPPTVPKTLPEQREAQKRQPSPSQENALPSPKDQLPPIGGLPTPEQAQSYLKSVSDYVHPSDREAVTQRRFPHRGFTDTDARNLLALVVERNRIGKTIGGAELAKFDSQYGGLMLRLDQLRRRNEGALNIKRTINNFLDSQDAPMIARLEAAQKAEIKKKEEAAEQAKRANEARGANANEEGGWKKPLASSEKPMKRGYNVPEAYLAELSQLSRRDADVYRLLVNDPTTRNIMKKMQMANPKAFALHLEHRRGLPLPLAALQLPFEVMKVPLKVVALPVKLGFNIFYGLPSAIVAEVQGIFGIDNDWRDEQYNKLNNGLSIQGDTILNLSEFVLRRRLNVLKGLADAKTYATLVRANGKSLKDLEESIIQAEKIVKASKKR